MNLAESRHASVRGLTSVQCFFLSPLRVRVGPLKVIVNATYAA